MTGPDKRVRRITWLALVTNLCLAAAKFMAGIFGHSQAVFADAVHTLSDAVTDVVLLVGMGYWYQPSDADHPYGHRRIETLFTAGLGLLLAATAVGLGVRATSAITARHAEPPNAIALGAALVSIAAKEILYHLSVSVGRKAKAPSLIANAWHHRSDALTSIPSALAVAGAMLLPKWPFLDHVGAIVVCVLLLQAAWRITVPALSNLVDTAPPEELRQGLSQAIVAFPQVKTAHAVRARHIGSGVAVDCHIQVDPDLTVRDGHEIAEKLKWQLMADFPDVTDVVVHTEPYRGSPPG